ncbi:hypothetical protein [Geomonas propionica]|uniref:Uncharacterized protein n=1 Tax=Geomonas propionica TaxID=2798582 RepID=A0ABS0YQK8_9BACT|nr:hypothetical protein [Geomonas propionica]MBJ6800214.1 hypothetical protein [Geomonas propionica]
MKLTNDEMLKLSDPNIPQSVKDYICEQKMDRETVAICRKMGVSLADHMIQSTLDGR